MQRSLCAEVGVNRFLSTEAIKDCSQGGVLFLLLLITLIDSLRGELQNLPLYVQAYTDGVIVPDNNRNLGAVRRDYNEL